MGCTYESALVGFDGVIECGPLQGVGISQEVARRIRDVPRAVCHFWMNLSLHCVISKGSECVTWWSLHDQPRKLYKHWASQSRNSSRKASFYITHPMWEGPRDVGFQSYSRKLPQCQECGMLVLMTSGDNHSMVVLLAVSEFGFPRSRPETPLMCKQLHLGGGNLSHPRSRKTGKRRQPIKGTVSRSFHCGWLLKLNPSGAFWESAQRMHLWIMSSQGQLRAASQDMNPLALAAGLTGKGRLWLPREVLRQVEVTDLGLLW